MHELAVCYDFFYIVVEQILSILFALGGHLIFEVVHIKCEGLVLVVALLGCLCVLTQNLKRLNHVLKCVGLLGSARYKRNQTVLIKTACLLRVYVLLHFCNFSFSGVEVEATHNRAEVVGGHVAVRVLVEQSEDLPDLCNNYFIQNLRFLCLTFCHFKLIRDLV